MRQLEKQLQIYHYVALCSIALLWTGPAAAAVIAIQFTGTSAIGLPGAVPAPFAATLIFDTDADVSDLAPEDDRAQFRSEFVTSLPREVPPEVNTVLREFEPELILGTTVTTRGSSSHPDDFIFHLGGYATRIEITLLDGATEDRLTVGLRRDGVFGASDQYGMQFSVTGDGDALWPGAGTMLNSLTALELLIDADLSSLQGAGEAAAGRASVFGAWTLSIDSFRVSAIGVSEPSALILLAGLLLLGLHRRLAFNRI